MDINVKNFSDLELGAFQMEIDEEVERRAHINKLVKDINELLYELNGTLTGRESLSFIHNQLGTELFNTKDVEEPEDAPGWFAPKLLIERTVK